METDISGDNIDAKGIVGKFVSKNREITISGPFESDEYSMNFPKKGKCYIFNHKEFDEVTELEVREGTNIDADGFCNQFKKLGFDTQLFPDLTVREIKNELLKAREKNDDYSCFVCCILSYGDQAILYANDGEYSIDEIVFAPFRGDVCPSLVGKPKIFFIQACEVKKKKPQANAVRKESFDSNYQFKLPIHADFLIVYSTVSGDYSWRNSTNGSWFIQALCDALQQHVKDEDLLTILTIVNCKVALDFESFKPFDESMHVKKQVPLITSTLTKDVKLS